MKNFFLIALFFLVSDCSGEVHVHGYWYGKDVNSQHAFDGWLANALVEFFKKENAEKILDLGCGRGDYIRVLQANEFFCKGYDGNPETYELSRGIAQVADISVPLYLNETFDWVLSLEVGEHIPQVYEIIFIENLHRHNSKGVVLSWAVKGQGGYGHFNEQNNDYIKNIMKNYGYDNDIEAEKFLRNSAYLGWFKNTIMVFRKK